MHLWVNKAFLKNFRRYINLALLPVSFAPKPVMSDSLVRLGPIHTPWFIPHPLLFSSVPICLLSYSFPWMPFSGLAENNSVSYSRWMEFSIPFPYRWQTYMVPHDLASYGQVIPSFHIILHRGQAFCLCAVPSSFDAWFTFPPGPPTRLYLSKVNSSSYGKHRCQFLNFKLKPSFFRCLSWESPW